jgi:hypothetical protein
MKPPETAAPAPDSLREAPRAALRSRLFRAAKRGESTSDDAGCASDERGLYALCDGASRSALAGDWAEILARQVCHAGLPPQPSELRAWLAPARAEWEARRSAALAKKPAWWNQVVRPGGATLFALEIDAARGDGDRRFTAVMRGDTCGFHVREGRLLGDPMPYRASNEFSANPECLMSMAEGSGEPDLRVEHGALRAGDVFFIATDALAKWILVEIEEGRAPSGRLLELDDPERFQAFADEERESMRMDEDDVSLLVVELMATDSGGAERGEASGEGASGTTGRASNRPATVGTDRPPHHHADRHRFRDRIVWSVLVPLVVSVVSSSATTLLLARLRPPPAPETSKRQDTHLNPATVDKAQIEQP